MSSEEDSTCAKDSPGVSPCSLSPPEEQACQICEGKLKQPKILRCLHVFCQACLESQVAGGSEDDGYPGSNGQLQSIICRICKQKTMLPMKGPADLISDYVLSDILDMSAIEDMQIVCTSCKAKEKAVARCSDCANFLCPNCVTAHQFMRCFENHKVVTFEEMQTGEGLMIHKTIFCTNHASENLKFFCYSCQVPICNDCTLNEHKQPEHHYERIADVEEKQIEDLRNLVSESRSKVSLCGEASTNLENALSELQMQRDNAKGLIQETFQSYKAILEKRKDDLLEEMEALHSNEELAIMDMFHCVEKTVEKIEDGCNFAERVLKHGNSNQILALKKVISSQLLTLINNTPKPDINFNIEFHTDSSSFENAVKATFGSFAKEDMKNDHPLSIHSSFENEGFTLPHGMLSPDHALLPPVSAPEFIPQMPPIMPPSMSSSHHDVAASLHSLASAPPVSMPVAITGGTQTMIPDVHSLSRNSHSPAMSDSGISVDAGSTNSTSSAPLFNIAALAKLGPIGFNSQGQVTVNGQAIPGLNMNNVTGLPHGRTLTPISQTDTTNLSSLLNTAGTSRSQTPNLETLAGLLNQSSGSMTSLSSNMPGNLSSLSEISNLGSLSNLSNMGNMTPVMSQASSRGDLLLEDKPNGAGIIGSGGGMGMFSSQGSGQTYPPVRRGNKMSAMQIRCKFGQLGPGKGQFNSPHGFCLGMEEDITVADTNNHRIQVFEKTGEFKYQFGIPGREEGQLWYPRKVAVMRNSGKYVVCDRGNERSRMQLFTKNGHFIKKIAIRYIDIVAGLAITQQGHIVAVDSVSPTVFCIAESGELIKWFDCSDYMREPSDIAISGKEYFVCDFKGHCVVVFNEEGQFMRRIGCENITNYPNGIDISDAGDVLVGDSHGNRFHVAVFQRDGSLIGEFECPYVKVSRCCGLKITSEGYVVTLAKNNHHVLVLNTLYIT